MRPVAVVGDAVELRVLRQVAERRRCGARRPRSGCGRAAEHPQQAGLARAVAADEADLVAGAHGEADVLHEETARHLHRELAHLQHGRPVLPASGSGGLFAIRLEVTISDRRQLTWRSRPSQ